MAAGIGARQLPDVESLDRQDATLTVEPRPCEVECSIRSISMLRAGSPLGLPSAHDGINPQRIMTASDCPSCRRIAGTYCRAATLNLARTSTTPGLVRTRARRPPVPAVRIVHTCDWRRHGFEPERRIAHKQRPRSSRSTPQTCAARSLKRRITCSACASNCIRIRSSSTLPPGSSGRRRG